jgi:hypothetical protein
MNVVDLDGNLSQWHLTGHVAKARLTNKSQYHLRCRELLVELFPTLQILEEVPIKTRKSETLYLDFYLPLIKTSIEVHGEQHYKFIGFYHHTMMDFFKSQKRDNEKEEWCSINSIRHIVLPYNEDISEWKRKINHD